jgi:ectoine hydroxylase-related dioxygenase (phytanoyl-CoA dioxygenase family)
LAWRAHAHKQRRSEEIPVPDQQTSHASRPAMGQLKTSNHLIGNREALRQAWDRDGYWYFKDVLDQAVIGRMREQWIDYLHRIGVVSPDVAENRYNGAPLDELRKSLSQVLEFNHRELHRMLTENPSINATMKTILGEDPFWLPIAEYRANAPGDAVTDKRLIYPHQDGFYSRGMPMKICWIPIDKVDADVGGCAWVAGTHRGPNLHDMSQPPLFPIADDIVPPEGWLRADFAPGDIVIFDLNLLHSGLSNISRDRFRISMDIRVTEASGPVPTIGELVELTERGVRVRNDRTGVEEYYAVNRRTYVRGTNGAKREGRDIAATFTPGEHVIVNCLDGRNATLVRSVH